jgi:hypothetical protein
MNRTVGAMGAMVVGVTLAAAGCDGSRMPAAPSATPGTSAAGGGSTLAARAGDEGAGAEIYTADLKPLNAHVGYGTVNGTARFQLVNGDFIAIDQATGMQPGMIHPQHIHAAAQCPPASADVNHDGFIDVIEGVPFYGAILVPLDSDLSTQAGGSFPTVDNNGGALHYHERASASAMLADLNAPDPNPNDAVVKLAGAPLDLSGRHVVLHGIALDTPLPSTVASLPGLPAQLTLPVACGEISKVN